MTSNKPNPKKISVRKKIDLNNLFDEAKEFAEKTPNVEAVFGEPKQVGDTTIIPVAAVSVRGAGGGVSSKVQLPAPHLDTGDVGSGGIVYNIGARPVGYIEAGPDGVRFVEVVDHDGIAKMGLVFSTVVAAMLGLNLLARTLKKGD